MDCHTTYSHIMFTPWRTCLHFKHSPVLVLYLLRHLKSIHLATHFFGGRPRGFLRARGHGNIENWRLPGSAAVAWVVRIAAFWHLAPLSKPVFSLCQSLSVKPMAAAAGAWAFPGDCSSSMFKLNSAFHILSCSPLRLNPDVVGWEASMESVLST